MLLILPWIQSLHQTRGDSVFLIPAFIVGWLLTARSRARIAAADSAAAGDSAR